MQNSTKSTTHFSPGKEKIQLQTTGKGESIFIETPILATKAEKEINEKHAIQIINAKGESGLIIDDEIYVADMLSKFLNREGYVIDKVTDGKIGLEKLYSTHYDFILCDIKMPGMDGMTLYRKLLERKYSNLDKIIFITGDTINEDIQDFFKIVKNQILSKPFDLEEAKKTIQQLLTQA